MLPIWQCQCDAFFGIFSCYITQNTNNVLNLTLSLSIHNAYAMHSEHFTHSLLHIGSIIHSFDCGRIKCEASGTIPETALNPFLFLFILQLSWWWWSPHKKWQHIKLVQFAYEQKGVNIQLNNFFQEKVVVNVTCECRHFNVSASVIHMDISIYAEVTVCVFIISCKLWCMQKLTTPTTTTVSMAMMMLIAPAKPVK